jgi:hypothetical protein
LGKNSLGCQDKFAASANRRFEFGKSGRLFIGPHNKTLPVAAMCVSNPGYRISVAAGGDRGFSKSNETALRSLLVRALDLRVSGSMQI